MWKMLASPGMLVSRAIMPTSTAMPTSSNRFVSSPTENSEREFVRQARPAPTCAMTMPAMVMAVA